MNVLVACEESQRVCLAFRSLGHNAFSCDLLPCSGGHPEYHIKGDVLSLINGHCDFVTQSGDFHSIAHTWDLIIAHPPCTYLTKASATCLYPGGVLDEVRYKAGIAAKEFFFKFLNCDCDRVCIENPTPLTIFDLPAPSQVIQPFYFGDPVQKRTCLWLKGLPILWATDIVVPEFTFEQYFSGSSRMRSKTFLGIASAMAEQWSI